MDNIIELKGIGKSFNSKDYIVRDINLTVKKGEFVTLLGPSGCGKTTTLRMIAGFETPTEGSILFKGKDISNVPPYLRPVNTVFQRYALFPHLNVFNNIAFGLNLKKLSKEEIAKKMGISVDKVREVIKISQEPVSLETPIGEEDDSHLGDFLKDEASLSPEEYTENEILKEKIKEVLQTLQPREQEVLELRFGLVDGICHTLEDVGKKFNVTRERIRQIEAKALRKLRHPSRAKQLKDFLDN